MSTDKKSQFGGLPARYGFVFNPYPDSKISRCPVCEHKTGQRKLPLLIHINPAQLVALNYTCRYCQACDLLIAQKHEIEHLLTAWFHQYDPALIGNDYLVVGTLEKRAWREGMQHSTAIADALPQASGIAKYYQELQMTQPGWYGPNQKPPVRQPPQSQEWVKK